MDEKSIETAKDVRITLSISSTTDLSSSQEDNTLSKKRQKLHWGYDLSKCWQSLFLEKTIRLCPPSRKKRVGSSTFSVVFGWLCFFLSDILILHTVCSYESCTSQARHQGEMGKEIQYVEISASEYGMLLSCPFTCEEILSLGLRRRANQPITDK